MLCITEKEKKLLPELRENVADILDNQEAYRSTDSFLTVWLRHKDHNLEKVEAALRKNAKWREDNKIEQIVNESLDDVKELLPYEHYGLDNDGRPIVWIPFGKKWDLATIIQNNLGKSFVRFSYQFCESLEILIRNEADRRFEIDGQIVWQFFIVIDAAEASFWQLLKPKAIKMVKDLASCAETNWPLRCGGVIVINAPTVVKTLYHIIKPLLSEFTRSVFQIYNCDREEWEKVLKTHISTEFIPISFGGDRRFSFE